jgi:hypothetical protein
MTNAQKTTSENWMRGRFTLIRDLEIYSAIGVTRSPSGSKDPGGLGEEAQHYPAEKNRPCYLRANQRSGKP